MNLPHDIEEVVDFLDDHGTHTVFEDAFVKAQQHLEQREYDT
jgi:hypothetical protein